MKMDGKVSLAQNGRTHVCSHSASLSPREIWEFGSEFHWYEELEDCEGIPEANPWDKGILLGTGRDALRLLLEEGLLSLGWKRLWIPNYFCDEVVAAIATIGIQIQRYEDRPGRAFCQPTVGDRDGQVLFVSNTFGLRTKPPEYAAAWWAVIEDHTHDPWSEWSRTSAATYCVASLRKTLPIPDGAALWSPIHVPLPECASRSEKRAAAVAAKTYAMLLKRLYLNNHLVSKETYRRLATEGERGMAEGKCSLISALSAQLLPIMPTASWREKRRRNFEVLCGLLERPGELGVLRPEERSTAYPFAVVCMAESRAERDALREYLIESSVYPAILWPDHRASSTDRAVVELRERILSFHCDFRYEMDDLQRVGRIVSAFFAGRKKDECHDEV